MASVGSGWFDIKVFDGEFNAGAGCSFDDPDALQIHGIHQRIIRRHEGTRRLAQMTSATCIGKYKRNSAGILDEYNTANRPIIIPAKL